MGLTFEAILPMLPLEALFPRSLIEVGVGVTISQRDISPLTLLKGEI